MNLRRLTGDAVFAIKARLGEYRLDQSSSSLAVLMYHGLEADTQRRLVRPLDTHPQHCLDEIRFFVKQGYQLVSPNQLGSLPNNGNYLLVSFDDGHLNIASHVQNWMRRYQIPFTLAVCPDLIEQQIPFWWEEVTARHSLSAFLKERDANQFILDASAASNASRVSMLAQLRLRSSDIAAQEIEKSNYVHRNMSWQQLKELAENPLCTLASHSMAHEIATSLSNVELLENAQKSKQILEQQCQQEVFDFVYPNGVCSQQTDQVIAKAGYQRYFGLGDAINADANANGHISRIRGYGKGSQNLQYYAHVWKQRHAAIGQVEVGVVAGY